ncbi:phage head spike fiber domain-containing protein [Rhodovibrionaceae bacterium A322]
MDSKTLAELLTVDRPCGKSFWAADGLLKAAADDIATRSWSPVNLLASPGSPAAQEITPGPGRVLTLRLTGSGRVKVTGAFEGTATAAQPLRIFTRSNAALRLRPIGEVSWFGAFDSLGLGQHAEATNSLLQSEDLAEADWTRVAVTKGTSVVLGADGSPMQKLTADAVESYHQILQSCSFVAGTDYVFHAKVAAEELGRFTLVLSSAAFGTSVAWNYDLGAGTATQLTAGTNDLGTLTPLDDGRFFHVTLTAQATITAAAFCQLYLADAAGTLSFLGDGVSGLAIDDLEVEQGRVPSPPIPTTTGAVTRLADAITTDLQVPEDFSAVIGPCSVGADGSYLLSLYNSGDPSGEVVFLRYVNGGWWLKVKSGGGTLLSMTVPEVAGLTAGVKMAFSRKAGVWCLAANGTAAAGVAAAVPQGLDRLALGMSGTATQQQGGFTGGLQILTQGLSPELLEVLSA